MKNTFSDKIIQRCFLIIGIAEAVYLGTLVLKMSFSVCAYIMSGMIGAFVLACFIWDIRKKNFPKMSGAVKMYPYGCLALTVLVMIQIISCFWMGQPLIGGDITAETMQSFLVTDGIYTVNPMTGESFLTGMPMRWKIIGLPGLYAAISRVTGMSVPFVCYRLIPTIVLLLTYLVYGQWAKHLFPKEKKKQLTFMIFIALIFLFGCYGTKSDSAWLLLRGWQGEAIRAGIILPYALLCLIRRKYVGVILAALAEICVVWTMYGLGYTVLMTGIVLAIRLIEKKLGNCSEKQGVLAK